MPKLPVVSGKETVRALTKVGFKKVGQRGSHIKLKGFAKGRKRTVIVPDHKVIRKGTLRNGIIKPAGLTVKEFIKLLRK